MDEEPALALALSETDWPFLSSCLAPSGRSCPGGQGVRGAQAMSLWEVNDVCCMMVGWMVGM